MSKHSTYGLFYIVLFPVALILSIIFLICLGPAFSIPILLLLEFVFAGFVVYTITSFIFYNRAIRQQLSYKPSLRDLIRVNAFIIIIPCLYLILQGIIIVANPGIINILIQQVKTVQPQMPPMSEATLAKLLLRLYIFLMVYAIVVIAHVIYTFRLLKQFRPTIES
jgi:hypothetical protein